jgi:hypothetical protein
MRRYTGFLGHEFNIRDPNILLPPCIYFIRKLNVDMVLYMTQYPGKYLTRILVDSLSSGLYNLRHLNFSGVRFFKNQISEIMDACLQDDHEFQRMLELNLGPLRSLQGVTLDFTSLEVPWRWGPWLQRRMIATVHSRYAIKQLFKRMDRELYTALRILATDLS